MEWISCFHLIQQSHIQPSEAISSGGLFTFIHIIDKIRVGENPPAPPLHPQNPQTLEVLLKM
jgi:hypothetical protein